MKRPIVLYILVAFALLGLIDATYIHIEEIAAITNPKVLEVCSVNSLLSCTNVLTSSYAKIHGVPVSLLGIFFYKDMLLFGIALLLGLPLRRWLIWAVSFFVAGSFLFSLYLLYISYFGIGAFCPLCLISNFTTLGVTISWFIFTARHTKAKKKEHA